MDRVDGDHRGRDRHPRGRAGGLAGAVCLTRLATQAMDASASLSRTGKDTHPRKMSVRGSLLRTEHSSLTWAPQRLWSVLRISTVAVTVTQRTCGPLLLEGRTLFRKGDKTFPVKGQTDLQGGFRKQRGGSGQAGTAHLFLRRC